MEKSLKQGHSDFDGMTYSAEAAARFAVRMAKPCPGAILENSEIFSMSQRDSQIDKLYATGILLVILGHSHSSNWDTFAGTVLESVIDFIYLFHMPLFFFIAGFLLMRSRRIEREGYKSWIRAKAVKLLTPYLALSAAAILPKYYYEHGSFAGFQSYFIRAVFDPRMSVWGHFWFIPVLLLLYAVFGLSRKRMNASNTNKLLTVSVVVSVVLYYCPVSVNWFGVKDFSQFSVYFVFGMIFQRLSQNRPGIRAKRKRLIWLSGMTAGVAVLFLCIKNNQMTQMLTALFLIAICWNVAAITDTNRLIEWISSHNFTIYIYSWLFQAVVMVLGDRGRAPWYLQTILMFGAGFLGPTSLILIYERMPRIQCVFLDRLLGVDRTQTLR